MMTSRLGLQWLSAKGTELELHDIILYVLWAAISKLPVNPFVGVHLPKRSPKKSHQ